MVPRQPPVFPFLIAKLPPFSVHPIFWNQSSSGLLGSTTYLSTRFQTEVFAKGTFASTLLWENTKKKKLHEWFHAVMYELARKVPDGWRLSGVLATPKREHIVWGQRAWRGTYRQAQSKAVLSDSDVIRTIELLGRNTHANINPHGTLQAKQIHARHWSV